MLTANHNSQMAMLTVYVGTSVTCLPFSRGRSVREILDLFGPRVRAACGGIGACGACVVRVLSGEVNPLMPAERLRLDSAARARGERLACQLRLLGDLAIQIDNPPLPSVWTTIPMEDLCPVSSEQSAATQCKYGLAVDLGTTHIRLSLWDCGSRQRMATRRGPNPQGVFGADVLSRLDAARIHAAELARLVRDALVDALRDMLARELGKVTPLLADVGRVMIVGNTAMLTLLTGAGYDTLIDPAYWQQPISCQPPDWQAWQQAWGLPNAEIVLPAPVAGFIGSDLVADLIATDLVEGPPGSMLLDLGTNVELALWTGQRVLVTSTPGGPAFEGVGIRHGMPVQIGAIYRVHGIDAAFSCEVIGGVVPQGFCGSGLLDGIARLLENGALKPSGRFTVPPGTEGYRLDPDNPCTAITGHDVDAFQRAKAATAAAMGTLLAVAGLEWSDLQRLCICGSFGHHLDLSLAQSVGLLPPLALSRMELMTNAALSGCEQALLDGAGMARFARLTHLMTPVNLSMRGRYDDDYLDHLRLKPISLSQNPTIE
ncbi:MAG: DUF4445 domain-containing protein [Magnetococcales bacterium]|nr:DUF4445 domain-containing protein [Magnetococcales bacterium]